MGKHTYDLFRRQSRALGMSRQRGQRRFGVVSFAVAMCVAGAMWLHQAGASNTTGAFAAQANLQLITEPDDGTAPISTLIQQAKSSVDVVMYQLEDTAIESDLARDAARGIAVRVLLNRGYDGEQWSDNVAAFNYLQAHGVQVAWTPAYFALTHQKTIVVDHDTAAILTFNLTPQYYASSRDFGIINHNTNDVTAIEQTFDADWRGQQITPSNGTDLVWSPNAEALLLSLIKSAKHTLAIYNEEMADPAITNALVAAARHGVEVQVVMTDEADWHTAFNTLTAAGVQVHTFAPSANLYIHAKMIVADSSKAFVGSENFSYTSLMQNRELGIMLTSQPITAALQKTFEQDYQASEPFR